MFLFHRKTFRLGWYDDQCPGFPQSYSQFHWAPLDLTESLSNYSSLSFSISLPDLLTTNTTKFFQNFPFMYFVQRSLKYSGKFQMLPQLSHSNNSCVRLCAATIMPPVLSVHYSWKSETNANRGLRKLKKYIFLGAFSMLNCFQPTHINKLFGLHRTVNAFILTVILFRRILEPVRSNLKQILLFY